VGLTSKFLENIATLDTNFQKTSSPPPPLPPLKQINCEKIYKKKQQKFKFTTNLFESLKYTTFKRNQNFGEKHKKEERKHFLKIL
jgi:hypothetical protein